MGSRLRSNWLRLALLQSLLIFTVSAGADIHQTDRNRDRDHGSDADGSLGGGPREGGGHQGGGIGGGHQDGDFEDDFDQDHDNGGGHHGGGRGDHDNDGGWGRDRDGRGGHDRGDRGGGRHGGGRGGHNRPDPNPYDPNYPESPCQRDPRFCNGGGGGNNGGWDQAIQRSVYLNQVFQQQYLDLNYLVGTHIGSLQGYGLTGVDVEILNSWGRSTIRLINNSRQIDVQNVYGQYVQLNSYLPLDLFYGNRVSLGIQGRVHIGQIVLHFSPLGRR